MKSYFLFQKEEILGNVQAVVFGLSQKSKVSRTSSVICNVYAMQPSLSRTNEK